MHGLNIKRNGGSAARVKGGPKKRKNSKKLFCTWSETHREKQVKNRGGRRPEGKES